MLRGDKLTIKEVAKYAGVSVATISRVLNEPDKVSDDTKSKVLKAIEETGYQQNLFGKHLRCKKTNIILVMLTSVVNSFCAKIVNSIDNEAKKHGYSIMICVTNDDPKTEERYLNYVKNKFVDGMIVINSTMNQQQMSELSSSFPVIQCSEYADPATTPYVTINNRQAAKDAVNHLIQYEKKDIMLIGVDNPNIISAKERLEGYREALEENNIKYDTKKVVFSNFGFKNTQKLMMEYFKENIKVDAIFAISDKMAAAAIVALQDKGLKVPEDVTVIGFDNTDISYIFNPSITTIAQPHKEMGKVAFQMLIERINERKCENSILKHELVIRKSTNYK